jgi:hypothetical protein
MFTGKEGTMMCTMMLMPSEDGNHMLNRTKACRDPYSVSSEMAMTEKTPRRSSKKHIKDRVE